jgi:hypothetical protein
MKAITKANKIADIKVEVTIVSIQLLVDEMMLQ